MSGMFVVCHMLASLDGKIDGAFGRTGAPAGFGPGDAEPFPGYSQKSGVFLQFPEEKLFCRLPLQILRSMIHRKL